MTPAALSQVVAVDCAALDAAASIAEEALACHREALLLLAEGWQSETGSAVADFMDRQCVYGGEVVDALRRASGQVSTLPDISADPSGRDPVPDRWGDPADPVLPLPEAAARAGDPIAAPPPPATAPAPVSPWTNPVPASAWGGPTAADLPWAAPPPGGLPAPSALPDVGGALMGLVAEIAQALGSYADVAPSSDAAPVSVDPNADAPSTAPVAPEPAPATALTDAMAPPATGSAVSPPDAPVAPPSPLEPAPTAPAELLAAERPPAPGGAAVEVPTTAAPAPAADTPLPATAPETPASPTPAADEKTPCEIAADELPKVGE